MHLNQHGPPSRLVNEGGRDGELPGRTTSSPQPSPPKEERELESSAGGSVKVRLELSGGGLTVAAANPDLFAEGGVSA